MDSDKEKLELLINKYLAGETTSQEEKILKLWLVSLDLHAPGKIDDRIGRQMKEQIDRRNGHSGKRSVTARLLRPLPLVAASLLVLGIIGFFFYQHEPGSPLPRRGRMETPLTAKKNHNVIKRFRNLTNSSQELVLEDGTKIRLAKGSTVLWPAVADSQRRRVELKGNAFFEVATNTKKPFIVHSGDLFTKVLGTSFYIKQAGERKVEVKLVSGRVVVHKYAGGKQQILAYLKPGQTLAYEKGLNEVRVYNTAKIVGNAIPKSVKSPVNLDFNDEPLERVLRQLEEFYHVKIIYDPHKVNDIRVYGVYNKNDHIGDILNAITVANGLSLESDSLKSTFMIKE